MQTAWVQNLSIRDNITFGLPFDQARYDATTHACALDADFAMLPSGDMSLGGLRGMNLSGGQRQRVNCARAAYFDADTVLLDNALSAVDHHTAEHMFTHCVRGMLANKTVVLVTHQLQVRTSRCHAILPILRIRLHVPLPCVLQELRVGCTILSCSNCCFCHAPVLLCRSSLLLAARSD